MEIQRFCRQQHVLLLKEIKVALDDDNRCELCKCSIDVPYYVCDLCKYYVHKLCTELSRQINHSFHPRHPLTLRKIVNRCDSCKRSSTPNYGDFKYSCIQCNFDLDVECALMSNSMTTCPEGQHCIQHSSHPHLLLLTDTNIKEDIECIACNSGISQPGAGVYYGCSRCNYFLHRQCMEQLPEQTLHPLHSHHGFLSLRARVLSSWKCKLCEKTSALYTLSFECSQCNLLLCVKCGANSATKTIDHEDGEHVLYFVEKTYTKLLRCNANDTNCELSIMSNSNEFIMTSSYIFRCTLDCDFKLHLLCGPLPYVIKHECHIHPLILLDSFMSEDTFDEYYCDVCETERNPRIRIYCCVQCKYVAHIHCVISEIIKVLKGDFTDVKLKMIREDLWKLPKEIEDQWMEDKKQGISLWTLKDLIDKLTESEREVFSRDFDWNRDYNRTLELGEKYIDEVLRFSGFTENDLIGYDFDYGFYGRKLTISSNDLAMKIVDVHGYWIPFSLVSVLKRLLYKYGDISKKSNSSLAMKSLNFFFICQVMKKMHTTLVIDINNDILHDWFGYIRFAGNVANFDVGFLEASLKEIARDFFLYLEVSKLLDDDIPTTINKKIAKLQKKMAEQEARVEKCKKFRESSSKQEFMKEGLNKVMKLKWKTIGEIGISRSWFERRH